VSSAHPREPCSRGKSGRAAFPPDHSSPTSGDNSVDGQFSGRGRIGPRRWTTGVHLGTDGVRQRPSTGPAKRPPVAPQIDPQLATPPDLRQRRPSTLRTGPSTTAVDLFMKNFKKNNGVDGAKRGLDRVPPGRDDTHSPEALRLSSGSAFRAEPDRCPAFRPGMTPSAPLPSGPRELVPTPPVREVPS
jgi:hypothetical protein